MSEDTTRNFLEVMRSFEWPDPEPIMYRLYYDESGSPVIYTMEALPGTYIEIDQETYTRASFNVRVRDGRLIVLQPKHSVSRLRPHKDSGTPCDPRDVCIVVDANRSHKKWSQISSDID